MHITRIRGVRTVRMPEKHQDGALRFRGLTDRHER